MKNLYFTVSAVVLGLALAIILYAGYKDVTSKLYIVNNSSEPVSVIVVPELK